MDVTLEVFKGEAAKRAQGRRRGPAAYPVALRRFAVKHARERVAAGCSVTGAAKELGVADATLTNWLKKDVYREAAGGGCEFREVVVEPTPAASAGLVLVTPSGLRVEGLDMAGVVALVRELG